MGLSLLLDGFSSDYVQRIMYDGLVQAPPGFQEQSQEEDHADRLQDYADLQVVLEVNSY